MGEQCIGCGSYHDLRQCIHCHGLLCPRCRMPHERVCEEVQKKKSRGLGPTVRQNLIQIPTAAPIDPVDQGLAGIAELLHEDEHHEIYYELGGSD